MTKNKMKALSVRQPWAWLIVNGYKDIENRSWEPSEKMIGQRIIIHASGKKVTKEGYAEFLQIVKERRIKKFPSSPDEFDYGCLVGSAIIQKVIRGAKSYWAERGCFHWVLKSPKKMRKKKKKGLLGFFTI